MNIKAIKLKGKKAMPKGMLKQIHKLAKDFEGDWTSEERDTLYEIEILPTQWRVIVEQPSNTTEWNYPVCVVEFVHNGSTATRDQVKEDWERFWWALDATSDYYFRPLWKTEDGDLEHLFDGYQIPYMADNYQQGG